MKEKKSFKWIPKQLGHKDLATTMNIYGHLIEADDDDIGDVIEQSLYYQYANLHNFLFLIDTIRIRIL